MSSNHSGAAQPLEELRYALAEGDAHRPPVALRSRVLTAALTARPAGRGRGDEPAIEPVEGYRRSVASLDDVLSQLTDAEWHRPALRGLDVQGLVGHMIGVERQLLAALAGGQAATDTDHVGSTQADALAQASRRPADTHAEWRELTAATLADVAGRDRLGQEQPVTLHTFTVPVGRMLVVRSFETWTHEEDIRRATGRPLAAPDGSRLRLMTDLAVSALPTGLNYIGRPQPGRTARIVLTGPGGGTWQASLDRRPAGSTDVRIVVDAVAFCRLVANRADRGDLDVDIVGDHVLAEEVFAGARALALD